MKITTKPIKSAEQALKEHKELTSIWSNESELSQRILIYIAELLEKQNKPKRKPTAYQKHVGKILKAGGTMQEATKSWKNKTSN